MTSVALSGPALDRVSVNATSSPTVGVGSSTVLVSDRSAVGAPAASTTVMQRENSDVPSGPVAVAVMTKPGGTNRVNCTLAVPLAG